MRKGHKDNKEGPRNISQQAHSPETPARSLFLVWQLLARWCLPLWEAALWNPRLKFIEKSGADSVINIKTEDHASNIQETFCILLLDSSAKERDIFKINHQDGVGWGKGGKAVSLESLEPRLDVMCSHDAECSAVTPGNSHSQNSCQAVT